MSAIRQLEEKYRLVGLGDYPPLVLVLLTGYSPIFDEEIREKAAAELAALREQLAEEEALNKLFSDCFHRGLQMWKAAHPEEEMWPSGDKNIVWLLEQVRAKDEALEEAQHLLRSTTLNWQEQCLFDCDVVLTKGLKGGGNA